MEPVLQVALDVMNLHRAVQIAREAVAGGADWVEVGTPLIKSEGMEAVRTLRREFPGRTIVADLKTMDTGGFETEIAAKAGADVVTIMGAADDGTVAEAVRAARKYGCRVMVDLMATDHLRRAREVADLGADYVCIHVSIDEQMRGGNPLAEVRSLAEASPVPVAVAGGLNTETAGVAVEMGAAVVIVGGAINKAPEPADAARAIKEAMAARKPVASELYKKYGHGDLLEAFAKVSTPNVADAQHKKGAMVGIRPVRAGLSMAGPAFTVRTADGDWAKPVEAIDHAAPGDVLVIDAGSGHTAVWGELATWSCISRGIAGVVIDGAVRDVDDIMEMGFPLFSRHIAPNAGEPKGFGELRAEVMVGGQLVRTGDWIVGDDSGVVVIPQERAVEVANRAIDIMERENRYRQEIKRGSTLGETLKLQKWEKVS